MVEDSSTVMLKTLSALGNKLKALSKASDEFSVSDNNAGSLENSIDLMASSGEVKMRSKQTPRA